jgi:capsular exopolysaccharide synthesis family protein
MSRIFEALSRTGGESADIIRKVVGDPAPPPASPDTETGDAVIDPYASGDPSAAPAESQIADALRRVYTNAAEAQAQYEHQQHEHEHQQQPPDPDTTALFRTGNAGNGPVEPGATSAIRTVKLHPLAPVLLFDDQHRKASEQYRMVRTRIVQHPRRPRLMTVTSGSPGDGKTFNAINLAGVLSLKDDSRVLLVDGDLRRSSVARSLGIDEVPGLGDVLRGKATLRSALVRVEKFDNLYVLPAGEPEDRPAELLDSPAWPTLCDIFRRRFTYTIVDAPPVAAVADYDLIQAYCDGVVLVVRQDHTNRAAFQKALNAVTPEKRVGVILNSSEDWWLAKTAGYYYYGNYDGYYYYGGKTKKP